VTLAEREAVLGSADRKGPSCCMKRWTLATKVGQRGPAGRARGLHEVGIVRHGKERLLFLGLGTRGKSGHTFLDEKVEIGDEDCLSVNKKVADKKEMIPAESKRLGFQAVQ
jgi:hypothetical protein